MQMLRHLKRAYWPMQWDTRADNPDHGVHGSGGGFLEASRFALGEVEMDAYTTVAPDFFKTVACVEFESVKGDYDNKTSEIS